MSVDYKFLISKSSKFFGYQSKKGQEGEIKIYIDTIWNWCDDPNNFVKGIIYTTLVERLCIEFAFQKIRCSPARCTKDKNGKCKIEQIIDKFFWDDFL